MVRLTGCASMVLDSETVLVDFQGIVKEKWLMETEEVMTIHG